MVVCELWPGMSCDVIGVSLTAALQESYRQPSGPSGRGSKQSGPAWPPPSFQLRHDKKGPLGTRGRVVATVTMTSDMIIDTLAELSTGKSLPETA